MSPKKIICSNCGFEITLDDDGEAPSRCLSRNFMKEKEEIRRPVDQKKQGTKHTLLENWNRNGVCYPRED